MQTNVIYTDFPEGNRIDRCPPESLLKLFLDYFSTGKKYAYMKRLNSIVMSEVPQRRVLGPILLNILINDIK